MNSFYRITEELKVNLTKPLPGLSAQMRMVPSHRGDKFSLNHEGVLKNSAVLISVFQFNGKISTLLIKRGIYEGVHSGQISFPGGKFEESDPSLTYTALRETEEEVGIDQKDIEIIGTLSPLLIPVSRTEVLPVVGVIKKLPVLKLNNREVEYPIIAPVELLKDKRNQLVEILFHNNLEIQAPYFKVGEEHIWGATAMIISEFIEIFPEN